jgi:hypothetical protein
MRSIHLWRSASLHPLHSDSLIVFQTTNSSILKLNFPADVGVPLLFEYKSHKRGRKLRNSRLIEIGQLGKQGSDMDARKNSYQFVR